MKLTSDIQIGEGGQVKVAWSVENRLAEPLYLFCLLDFYGFDPNLMYHVIEGWRCGLLPDDGLPRLVLAKSAQPLKDGVRVYVPEMPYAKRLDPGQRFAETVRQTFPQRQHNYHAPFGTQEGLKSVTCRQVSFRVGYTLVSAFAPEQVGAVRHEGADYFLLPFLAALEAQQLLESDSVPAELSLWLQ